MIQLNNIYKTFHKGTVNEKKALNGLNLQMKKGDFVTVIGGNGAGKSTMLNVISGVYYVESGSVILDDKDITKKPEYKRARYLGRVFQDPMKGTAADLSIEENRENYKERLKLLDLGLENRLKSKVGLLSGGQRQALTLLMATLQKPKLLLLDEHTAALDPKTAAKVLHITEQIIEQDQLTALMITHNMKDALRMGNRLVMMHDGKIIFDVEGEEKKKLTVSDLLEKFQIASGDELANDRMLLG